MHDSGTKEGAATMHLIALGLFWMEEEVPDET